MLRVKVIVIDEVERKPDKLGIDEVMGLTDEYTNWHQARFILVFNSDQLANREVWDTLRETRIALYKPSLSPSLASNGIRSRTTSPPE
jgi:hypothetical protein